MLFSYYLRQLFKNPHKKLIYFLSGLVPRNPNLWVVGAQKNSFNCNPKYFFLHAQTSETLKKAGIRVCWISGSKDTVKQIQEQGLPAFYEKSFKGRALCLRAKLYFYNCSLKDISFHLSKGATRINLWHGIPLKKIQYDNSLRENTLKALEAMKQNKTFNCLFNPEVLPENDYVLSPSNYVTEYGFQSAFRLPIQQFVTTGYPRTDIFSYSREQLTSLISQHNPDLLDLVSTAQKSDQTLLYAPTWRDTDTDFIKLTGINFGALNKKLKELNYLLLIKLHPYTRVDTSQLTALSNIKLVDNRSDIYPVMPFIDKLITDYSSIYFDYLLLDRPVIFFPFDLDDYLKNCRDFYLNYKDVTPGPIAHNASELELCIFDRDDAFTEQRHLTRKQFWQHEAGGSSERLINAVMKI